MNINIRQLLCFFVLPWLLVSCYPSVNPEKQQEARKGVDAALAQLPAVPSFTIVKILVYESYDNEHGDGPVCYYAKAYIVAGSSLRDTEAVDTYTQKVQILGWSPDSDQHATERVLNRGANERMVVSPYEPGIDIQDAVGYTQLTKEYKSVIIIRVDYTVPGRDGC